MKTNSKAERFFEHVMQWPKTIITLGLLLIVITGSLIPTLQKDTRSDAFMPADHQRWFIATKCGRSLV